MPEPCVEQQRLARALAKALEDLQKAKIAFELNKEEGTPGADYMTVLRDAATWPSPISILTKTSMAMKKPFSSQIDQLAPWEQSAQSYALYH